VVYTVALIGSHTPPPDELSLAVAGAARGDEAAIRAVFRWINPSLLRYLHFHAGWVAEDLASEVWLDVARGLRRFEGGPAEMRAFVFTVARCRLADHHRRMARTPRLVPIDEASEWPAADDPAERGLEALITRRAVEELVRDLPADQAEIVLLRVLGDLDVSHVATLVGKSAGAVRVAQHRALQRLRSVRSARP
jgi:RNA polymerase sigma-70 factor (ECF subfamily)